MTRRLLALRYVLVTLLAVAAWAQTNEKKIVKSDNDLPRFTYPVKESASALLQSDDASFHEFATKVRADLEQVLRDYEITDKGTIRTLLRAELDLEIISGEYQAALETNDRLRREQEKPSAKLTAGIVERAWFTVCDRDESYQWTVL